MLGLWTIVILSALIIFIPMMVFFVLGDPEFRRTMRQIKNSSEEVAGDRGKQKIKNKTELNQHIHAGLESEKVSKKDNNKHKRMIAVVSALSVPTWIILLYFMLQWFGDF